MQLVLISQTYYDANIDTINSLASAAGVGLFAPVAEGALLLCGPVDYAGLPTANGYVLPDPLPDELEEVYRARIAVDAVNAYNSVVAGSLDFFAMSNEQRIYDCRAAAGWPQPSIGV